MSHIECLFKNGLGLIKNGTSYREWKQIMREDENLQYCERMSLDDLWDLCQYVIHTYESKVE